MLYLKSIQKKKKEEEHNAKEMYMALFGLQTE